MTPAFASEAHGVSDPDETHTPRAGRLSELGRRVYEALCGRHPRLRPWHFQWLIGRCIYRDFRRVLPRMSGRVLDVGCGEQPYRSWLDPARVHEYVGADITAAPGVAVVIRPGEPWPLDSASFDGVLCTQVLEHVSDADAVVSEIGRLLKPGGLLVVSVPFVYNEHGIPLDFRRFSGYGVERLFARDYDIVELERQGALGTTLGTLFLNWFIVSRRARVLAGALMPLWILGCLAVNALAVALDRIDRTGAFYANVLLVARKR